MADAARGGEFEFRFGSAGKGQGIPRRREDGDAMRILVMGDFSGRGARGEAETGAALAGREVVEVDVESFDGVMARMGATILDPLASAEDALPVEFRSLEDFHPDRLVRRVEAFGRLRGIRERLREASTFEGAGRGPGRRSLRRCLEKARRCGGRSRRGWGSTSRRSCAGWCRRMW
jgi:type VI secretion system ImpB/VipA family protein